MEVQRWSEGTGRARLAVDAVVQRAGQTGTTESPAGGRPQDGTPSTSTQTVTQTKTKKRMSCRHCAGPAGGRARESGADGLSSKARVVGGGGRRLLLARSLRSGGVGCGTMRPTVRLGLVRTRRSDRPALAERRWACSELRERGGEAASSAFSLTAREGKSEGGTYASRGCTTADMFRTAVWRRSLSDQRTTSETRQQTTEGQARSARIIPLVSALAASPDSATNETALTEPTLPALNKVPEQPGLRVSFPGGTREALAVQVARLERASSTQSTD